MREFFASLEEQNDQCIPRRSQQGFICRQTKGKRVPLERQPHHHALLHRSQTSHFCYPLKLAKNIEVHLQGSEPSAFNVTFDSKGVASFEEFADLSVPSRPISLSATYTTGVVKAGIKLKPNEEGFMEVSSATGNKAVTSTRFALPDDGSLSGWGGIEGGDVGWRLKRH